MNEDWIHRLDAEVKIGKAFVLGVVVGGFVGVLITSVL